MRIIVLIFLVTFGVKTMAQEGCKREYLINTPVKVKLMADYVSSSVRGNFFVNGKGVIKLIRFKDSDGNENWSISVMIDDSYKENLPTSYALFGIDVILAYDGEDHKAKVNPFDAQKLKCLESVIQNRLYIRPPFQDKYMTYDGIEGRPFGKDSTGNFVKRIINREFSALGNTNNGLWVIFNKDMTEYKTGSYH